MSLEKRELQRRMGLRQQHAVGYLGEHQHSMWWNMDYPLYLGDKTVNTLPNTQIGQILMLNPVALMYAVKAEAFITYTFAGGGPDFTVTLKDCSGTTSQNLKNVTTHEVYTWDVSDWLETSLKELCSVGLKSYVQVSNAGTPVIIHGLVLRFTMYKNDSYGGYNGPVDPLLILKSNTNKDYIQLQAKLAENFHYLSGLPMS